MRFKIALIALLLAVCGVSFGQTTTVSATVTDSSGTAWTSAAWSLTWAGAGVPSTTSGQSFTLSYSGTTNSSGVLSQSVTDTAYIVPSSSNWKLCVTSATSQKLAYCALVPATGATYSATTLINSVIQPP